MKGRLFTLLLVTVTVDSFYKIIQNLSLVSVGLQNDSSQTAILRERIHIVSEAPGAPDAPEVPDAREVPDAPASPGVRDDVTTTSITKAYEYKYDGPKSEKGEVKDGIVKYLKYSDTTKKPAKIQSEEEEHNNGREDESPTEGSTDISGRLHFSHEEESKSAISVDYDDNTKELEGNPQDGGSTGNNDYNNTNDGKVCLIHAGPHKTASSTLQVSIFQNEEIRQALKNDNYRVPIFRHGAFAIKESTPLDGYDPKNHAMLAHCLLGHTPLNIFCPSKIENRTMDAFETFVNKAGNDGANILLTSEAFDRHTLDVPRLLSYLEPHNYNPHFVIYYRRFYDWIFSTYYQQMGKRALRGLNVETFLEWLEIKLEESQLHYTVSLYNRLREFSSVNVTIVNMHQDESTFNVVERFFCDHADRASHTCDAAKSELTEKGTINTSKDLDWHLFRVKLPLYHPIELSDDDSLRIVKEKFSNMTDIPKLCLTPALRERILKLSIEMEIASTPEWWYNSDEGLKSLKADFEEKVKSKLCFVDTAAVVRSTEWQDFLTTTSDSIHSSYISSASRI